MYNKYLSIHKEINLYVYIYIYLSSKLSSIWPTALTQKSPESANDEEITSEIADGSLGTRFWDVVSELVEMCRLEVGGWANMASPML